MFNDQNSYMGQTITTNAEGNAEFRLPVGTWKFRADHLNNQYWASLTIFPHQINTTTIDTGGASFTLNLEKAPGQPMAGVKIYAFTSSGSYLGLNQTSDETGTVSFDLSQGDYKFRADYLGYQFWTQILPIPENSSSVLTIPHQDVTITINSLYDTPEPMQNVKIYLFTESGSYQSIQKTTDLNGTTTFNVPNQAYKIRADYMSKQYWSDPFTMTDTSLVINHAKANIHITMAGEDISNARTYLFSESGSYLSRFNNTDEQGLAEFILPVNTYKFRVDHNGTQYWSDPVTLVANQESHLELNLDLLAKNLTANPNYARYDGEIQKQPKILLASTGSVEGYLDKETSGTNIFYFINDHLGTPSWF